MARDYGTISHGFWTGETGRAMRGMPWQVRMVASYLMTCGSATMIGIYYLPLELLVHEVGSGLTLEGAREALGSLAGLDFAYYDEAREMVWVPNLARIQIGERLKPGDKQREGVMAQLAKVQKCPFVRDFFKRYRTAYCLPEQEQSEPHGSPMEAPPKDLPSPSDARDQRSEIRDQIDPPLARARAIPTGWDLVQWFGRIRSEIFPSTLPWKTARDTKGDAQQFASMLAEDEIQDLEATMRLALQKIRDGAEGWKGPRFADPSFAFGSWKSGFHALREELHGRAPKPPAGAAVGRAPAEGAEHFTEMHEVKL